MRDGLKRRSCVLIYIAYAVAYNVESLDFYDEVTKFQQAPGVVRRRAAPRIMSHFVCDGAPEQINIPAMVSAEIELLYEKCRERNDFPRTLFDSAKAEVVKLLVHDVFRRYTRKQRKTRMSKP